jgi:hypothetical protein
MEPCKVWIEKCEAARMIEDEFGTDKALTYLTASSSWTTWKPPRGSPTTRRNSLPSLPRSRRSSSPGNWRSF